MGKSTKLLRNLPDILIITAFVLLIGLFGVKLGIQISAKQPEPFPFEQL